MRISSKSTNEQNEIVDKALEWINENLTELKVQTPFTDDNLFSLLTLPITEWITQLIGVVLQLAQQVPMPGAYASYRLMANQWFQTTLTSTGSLVRMLCNLSVVSLLRHLEEDPTRLTDVLDEWRPVLDATIEAPDFWKEFHIEAMEMTAEEVVERINANTMADLGEHIKDEDKTTLH
jgi:hypothetical protein